MNATDLHVCPACFPLVAKWHSARLTALQGRIADLERELAAAREDADRWTTLCALWGASTGLVLAQEETGFWSIKQLEAVEEFVFAPLVGEDPNATIDAARAAQMDGGDQMEKKG